ncbi:S9 family peptidase [Parahaliea mediterranea]|uniref:S9 family peptidase n=1 Tax=Parahaliea mediterranea TaxID=651086 RepID=A0A939DGG7_9GAMM|nr:S9 family peptidase [Parahaliea mediterranea]MBN7797665.1 S9 family peptidase [Parahaliea mediterranea]
MRYFHETLIVVAFLSLLSACGASPPKATHAQAPTALIDREILFGNPTRFQGRVSPDGRWMSFRAPLEGVMNLWLAPVGQIEAARPITRNTGGGIPAHFWALDSESVLYIEDQGGDENWHIYRVDIASGRIQDLSPFAGVQAQFIAQSERHPGVAVIGMNDRDPRWHDVYRVNLATGERTLLARNDRFSAIHVDNNLEVRLATAQTQGGGATVYRRDGDAWRELLDIPPEDYFSTRIVGFTGDNSAFYMVDSRGRDTAALARVNAATGESRTMAMAEDADISDVLVHPRTHKVIAVAANRHQRRWQVLDERYAEDFRVLAEQSGGDVQILAATLDGEQWVAFLSPSDASPVYALYDRQSKTLEPLFVTNTRLAGLPLAPKHNEVITSRDGLPLVSYLTLPVDSDADGDGRPEQPLPLVLLVHGGPWSRDSATYSGEVQWLANRGYAVLEVNFRGSTGFGKAFTNAGNHEWAGKMHDDLIDAVDWAVARRVARRDRVGIMGTSYGGYATLVGLTFTPETFACGVDVVGPSNLNTLLNSIPPYWAGFRRSLVAAIGDPDTEKGRALLAARSPVNRVEAIQRPLLIGQGANDPRVKQAESDQIVGAMRDRDIPVTYVLFPDEGHGFRQPENSMAFYAVAERFLGECLGGRVQAIGDDFTGSSIQVKAGASHVPGVAEALAN